MSVVASRIVVSAVPLHVRHFAGGHMQVILGARTAQILHVVDADHRTRAQIARMFMQAGGHAEIYEHLDELVGMEPSQGVILIKDAMGRAEEALAKLHARDVWLPVVLFSENPQPSAIVRAIHCGATDYLAWPFSDSELKRSFAYCEQYQEEYGEAIARKQRARLLVGQLSRREKDVLHHLIEGHSNKSMAQAFGLSPRTVEDYRFSLIQRLGVTSTSAAIRIGLEAGLRTLDDPDADAAPLKAYASR